MRHVCHTLSWHRDLFIYLMKLYPAFLPRTRAPKAARIALSVRTGSYHLIVNVLIEHVAFETDNKVGFAGLPLFCLT